MIEFGEITPLYLDTSCAVKLFCHEYQEEGSEALKKYRKHLKNSVFVGSQLLLLEWHSVFRSRLRGNLINKRDFEYLYHMWKLFEKSISLKPITDDIIETAIQIMLSSNVKGRVRSLDCIHFATFLERQQMFPKTVLLSADTVMCELAEEANKQYFNPLEK